MSFSNPPFSLTRIGAMIERHWYLLRSSWPRLLDLVYWPTLQMTTWGFIQTFLASETGLFAQAFGVLIAAALLWDVLFRGQIGFALSFFEEVWSRNLGHLLVTPLRIYEFGLSLMVMSLIRTLIGLVPTTFLAIWFFGFSVYDLGLALVAFFFNLIVFSWAVGFVVSGVVLRNGLGAEGLAWALIFAISPVAGVYYPVDILPQWVQVISYSLPVTYVFEGMRSILIDRTIAPDLLIKAVALNAVYLAAGAAIFMAFFRTARQKGILLQIGE